jgi:Tol biopolymer transport system component
VQNRHLVQLTFDAGESSFPSLSPDAKLVAFQSDRAGPGRFDIWVQQTAGGSPLRLTTGTGSYRHPVFSNDGSKIYFESTGTPQGIYEMSALGGDPRLVVASARGQTLSLDGRLMAYFSLPSLQIHIRPSAGGEAHAIGPGLSILGGLTPIWFDDAQYVAAFAQKTGQPETREWWAIPVENGEAMRLSWSRWAAEHHHIGLPGAVLPRQSALATRANENRQIYLVKTEGLLRTPIGEPEPFTSGAAWSENASVAAGKVAFQSGIPETAVWSLPANTTDGRVTGDLERVTMARAVHANVSATPDGKTIVFSSNQTGSMDVLIRDMASGQEHALTSDAPQLSKQYALVDTAGTEVVYSMSSPESRGGVYVVSARGGASRKICDGCSPTLSLAPDGKRFLAYQADAMHSHINIVDVASGHATPLLQHPQYAVTTARFSPDGRWVAFLLTRGAALADVVVAPMRGTEAIPGPDWLTVTPAPADVQQVFWSPDGGLVYYVVTTAGGASSILARHLDAGRHPVGPPIRVYDFTGRVRPPISAVGTSSPVPDTLSAVPGRFIGVLSELNYNIWMMDLPK